MVLAPPAPYYRLVPRKREPTNLVEPKTPLGRFVRDERKRQGNWSQDELAARANASNPDLSLTFTSISNIERGKTTLPDPPIMIGIAKAFGMHVCELYVHAGFPAFAPEAELAAWTAETSPAYAALRQTAAQLTAEEQARLEQVARRMIETRSPSPVPKPAPERN